jgi:exopolyphosphatase / guanosine-5'-triphosphate,3'-diphosphate pyrophosphatase
MSTVAAIDCGTNSTRLLVHDGARILERLMVITRLGQGVDATGRLADDAIARTVAVLRDFRAVMDRHGVERVRMAATSAARDAANRDEFFATAEAVVGARPELLAGDEEGRLSFLGATSDLDPADGPFLVLDIGGGSTEFVVGARPGVADDASSIRIGSVRLTERAVRSDPPTTEDLGRLRELVAAGIDEAARATPVERARTFVSVAGTATTIQAIALGLGRYDPDVIHRSWLTVAEAERVLAALAEMTNEQRAAIRVMAPGRGDVIVAGGVILVEVMRRFGFDRTLVSETDILDGLAFEMLGVR